MDRARRRGARRHLGRRLLQPLRLAEAADQGLVGEHRHRAPPPVRPHPQPRRDRARLRVARARPCSRTSPGRGPRRRRRPGAPAEQAAAEGPFVAALRQLFAVVENYPDLKANQNFLALQQRAGEHRGPAADRPGASTTRTCASTTSACSSSRRRSSRACSTSSRRSSSRSTRRSARPARRRSASRAPALRVTFDQPPVPRVAAAPTPPAPPTAARGLALVGDRVGPGALRAPGSELELGCRPAPLEHRGAPHVRREPHPHERPHDRDARRGRSPSGAAPKRSAAQPVTSADASSVSVMSAKSNAKIRPRIRSGTMRCSP